MTGSGAEQLACRNEPISFLRLERYLQGDLSLNEQQRIQRHLGECGACRLCFEQLRDEPVELPPLPLALPLPPTLPLPPARVRAGRWALAAAAALVAASLLVLRSPPEALDPPPQRVAIKGGELAIELVREHAGSVAADPTRFAPGDRFQVRVTCPPDGAQSWQLVVFQADQAFFPLESSALLTCGNATMLPGAFELTGSDPAQVCIELGSDAAQRQRLQRSGWRALSRASACATLTPAKQ